MNKIENRENHTATTNVLHSKVTVTDLLKILNQIKSEPTTIYVIDFTVLTSHYLSENTIIVSKDVGEELEKRGLIVKP